jgi:predicted permease
MGLWSRLRKTFHSSGYDVEIEEEIKFHLAMKAQNGTDLGEARIRFGNVSKIREEIRAAGVVEWVESILKDARYGLRQLRKTPLLTAAIVFSLGIGIGANTAIFSIIDAALLKALPVHDPKSLVLLQWTNHGWPEFLCEGHTGDSNGSPIGSMQGSSIAPRIYRQLSRKQRAFASLVGFSDPDRVGVVANGRPAEQAPLQYVSGNFFEGLGVSPRLGRAFLAEEDAVGKTPVIVISYRFWQRELGGRQDVLGQSFRVNSVPAKIIGVAPRDFYGVQIGEWIDLYAPLSAKVVFSPRLKQEAAGEKDTDWWVRQMARLKPGVAAHPAIEQLSALFQQMVVPEGVHLDSSKIPKLMAQPGRRGFDAVGGDESEALWILLLLVGLLLLIVCANVANLLLSRAVARQRESAVCLALGAPRWRLFRQHLTESLILGALGGTLGLVLGYLGAQSIHSVIRTSLDIGGFDLHVNSAMLGYTAGISLATALIFGVLPSFRLANARLNDALKANNRSVLTGRLRLPGALVIVQIALCLTVLTAASLLGRSLLNLERMDVGFNRQNLAYTSVNPWSAGYNSAQVGPYVERLRTELSAIPGVVNIATISTRLLSGSTSATNVNIPGRPYREDGSDTVLLNNGSDGLFETLNIPLLSGRTFNKQDIRAQSSAVIVDELFARKFFPHEDALGLRFGLGPKPEQLYEVVGIVRSSLYNSLRRQKQPTMYRPFIAADNPGADVNFAIRAAIDSRQLSKAVRRAAAAVDPNVPVTDFQTQTALIDRILLMDRLLSMLSSAFGLVALALSALGLAGLLSYAVARRKNEIGIRMALGASSNDVIGLVMKDSLWLVGAGLLIGIPAALLIGRVLRGTLFRLQPGDPLSFALSLSVLAIVAGVSAWAPASRAAKADPLVALREE